MSLQGKGRKGDGQQEPSVTGKAACQTKNHKKPKETFNK
jgi:hypothetical protein